MPSLASWVNLQHPLLLPSTGQVLAPTLFSSPASASGQAPSQHIFIPGTRSCQQARALIQFCCIPEADQALPFYPLAVILAYPPRDLSDSICAGASSQPFPSQAQSLQGLCCDSNTNGRSICNLHLLRAARPTSNCLYLSTCQCQALRYLCANLFRHCSNQLHFPRALPQVVTLLTNLLCIINPLGHLLSTLQPSSG